MVMKDYYIILGLPKGADKSRIKKAYRDIAKKLHPDKSASSINRSKFLEAKEAYETLTDDAARKKYDQELERRSSSGIRINRSSSRKEKAASRTDRSHKHHSYPWAHRTRSRYHRDYRLVISLTSDQARTGGEFTVTLPYVLSCARCRQTGRLNRFYCPDCSGNGIIRTGKDFIITLPPGLVNGDSFRRLAYDNGFVALYLNVRIRLDPFS